MVSLSVRDPDFNIGNAMMTDFGRKLFLGTFSSILCIYSMTPTQPTKDTKPTGTRPSENKSPATENKPSTNKTKRALPIWLSSNAAPKQERGSFAKKKKSVF